MLSLFIISTIFMIIPPALMLITYVISAKSAQDREKNSPFECGFNPIKKNVLSFSLRFFLVIIIFLIFDVEVALLVPACLMSQNKTNPQFIIVMSALILVLIVGLIHEWNQGSLDWIS